MDFGTTIKKLRRNANMTQEQLADTLSISAQAISRWETNTAMPDVLLLPTLANLFNVTTDYLLGVDITKKIQNIEAIKKNAENYMSRGYLSEARNILEEGLCKYPNSYKLIYSLMYVANWQYNDIAYRTEEKNVFLEEKYKNEAINLAESILSGCTEDDLRHSAIQILCFLYKDNGDNEKARRLAMSMPIMAVCRESLLPVVTDGTDSYRAKQSAVFNFIQFLEINIGSMNIKLDSGKYPYEKENQAVLRDKQIAFLHLMFENGDFGFFHCHLCDIHTRQAKHYASICNTDKVIEHLREATNHAINFIQSGGKETHTSLLFVGFDNGEFFTTNSDNDAAELLKSLDDSIFNNVRDTVPFISIKTELSKYADKWHANHQI